MNIIVNGELKQINTELSIQALVETLDLANKRYALELNQSILPRSQYPQTILSEGDKIEIIHAVGGG